MHGERYAAAATLWSRSARTADQRSRAAAAIDEENALLVALEPLAQRLHERIAKDRVIAAFKLHSQVNDRNGGHGLRAGALTQLQQRDAPLLGRRVAFERRRGASEQ